MSKSKYRYNPQTLSYEKVERSFWERVLRSFIFLAPGIAIGLIFGLFTSYKVGSPKERKLAQENQELKVQFEDIQKQAELIDKVAEIIKNRDEDIYRTAFGAKEFPEELRMMGVGGSDVYASLKNLKNSELIINTRKKLDEVERKLHAQSISFKELTKLAKDNENRLAALPAIQPINNKNLKRVASGYGWRIDPIYGTKKMHWGLDFSVKRGTKVFATADGTVEEINRNRWGYGNEIVVNHGYGYRTRYAHLSKFEVKEGDKVSRGDLIALSGSSGKSTGPHLHYEVEKNGQKVYPGDYFHSDLSPAQYEEITRLSQNALKAMD